MEFIESLLAIWIRALVHNTSKRYELKADYVAAIIMQESVKGTNSLMSAVVANRKEEGFFKLYIKGRKLTGYEPPKGALPSEATRRSDRATSWGLMQIMGTTAREHGFSEQFLTTLLWPHHNIEIGCRVLRHYLEEEGGDYREALRRYNGRKAGDYTYVEAIEGVVQSGEHRRFLYE